MTIANFDNFGNIGNGNYNDGNKFDNIGKSSTFGNNGKGFGAQIKMTISALHCDSGLA